MRKNLAEAAATRRDFLIHSGTFLGMAALAGSLSALGCGEKEERAEVTATEGLMRDHGLGQRLLLIYDEIAHRLRCCKDFPPGVLAEATGMVRRFLQDHHEKLEEELLFPRFEQSGQQVALVTILRQQHAAGRQLLDLISGLATPETAKNMIEGARLTVYLNLFTRLYRPHTAREDTVLFPALRTIVTPREFNSLAKQFLDRQTRLGPDGYEKLNTEISDLEKALNLHDLPQFTPKL